MFDLIIAAAGESTRFNSQQNKLLCNLNGRTVLENAVIPFLSVSGLNNVIIAASPALFDEISALSKKLGNNIIIVFGGRSRTASVKNALASVTAEKVLIHDGARPFVTTDIINDVLSALNYFGAAVPVTKITDSICNISSGYSTLNRDDLRAVQTPQGFDTEKLTDAYAGVDPDKYFTDDAAVYMTKYSDVTAVLGSPRNKKITVPNDIAVPACRVGAGYDTHILAAGRKLILGGVTIPFDKGLVGHSDADVLAHAIMDALLSAAGERDIGWQFPETDDAYKNADSMKLLQKVLEMLKAGGYSPNNISATILAEKPKLSLYIPEIIDKISAAVGIDKCNIGIAATTAEGVGDIGRGLAVSVIATATIIKQ